MFPYRLLTGTQLRRFVVDALPFTEADAESSPDPVTGGAHFG
jgi:hypothetical protein